MTLQNDEIYTWKTRIYSPRREADTRLRENGSAQSAERHIGFVHELNIEYSLRLQYLGGLIRLEKEDWDADKLLTTPHLHRVSFQPSGDELRY